MLGSCGTSIGRGAKGVRDNGCLPDALGIRVYEARREEVIVRLTGKGKVVDILWLTSGLCMSLLVTV
jgi:hypothetical protein